MQGLDVVVFAILKRCLSEEHDAWERKTGEAVSKTNFLAIYGRAHLRALTPATIRSAFCKTGIHPFDRSVIPTLVMAASKETLCQSHLPSVLAPEIQELAEMMWDMAVNETEASEDKFGQGNEENDNVEADQEESYREEGDELREGIIEAEDGQEPVPMSTASANNKDGALHALISRLSNGLTWYHPTQSHQIIHSLQQSHIQSLSPLPHSPTLHQ